MKVQNVIVVGCGRLGALLANNLSREGCSVTVVDRNSGAFKLLDADFSGFCVTGDATELQMLKEAGVEGADCLLAATEKDTVNLMVTQVAKTVFGVKFALARVYDPRREKLYRSLGVETISPTVLIADQFLSLLGLREGVS